MAEISILTGGILSLFLALYHCAFYRTFRWNEQLPLLTQRNQRILYTLHIAVILFLFVFALLSFFFFQELARCQGLALGVNVVYALIWLWRLIWQITYVNQNKTIPVKYHYSLSIYFLLLHIVYIYPLAVQFI